MRKAQQRLWIVLSAGVVLVLAATLAGLALRDAAVFFYSPADIAASPPEPGQRIRVGGLVVDGSVDRLSQGGANFTITDGAADIRILYSGSLPDIFREGQGIVAEGTFNPDQTFTAMTVLAKHDENYLSPEVADALKESGYWQEEGASSP